ncbi:hypothetical protein LBMAG42_35880 [Deltaproteobacteria bacterium]|nr:hypothetical protein LBMAG42_35880 [Deltaproteobacteria bacterium]
MPLLLQNVVLDGREPPALAAAVLGLPEARIVLAEVVHRGLDARSKTALWRGNIRVSLGEGEAGVLARNLKGVRLWTERDEVRKTGLIPTKRRSWPSRPIVVGAGPAGLFAALRLMEAGAPVLLLERGEPVETRVGTVNGFWRGKPLNPESNLLFGEGGAGTFSDGKVYTRRRDGDLGWIFRHLVDAGADSSVLEESWAHLGTDKIRAILPVLRKKLIDGGGEVRFGAQMTDLIVQGGRCVGVRLANGEEILGGPVIVAAGHSARDTIDAMLRAGAVAEVRPIAIGARVEHPQALIDAGLYPKGRGDLPPASYRLAYNPAGGRSAYSFCMCPGGMVVPAQHEPETNVVNGMSFAARRAVWANSAVIVQVSAADYGATDPRAGQRFQDAIERAAWKLTGSYAAPAQRVDDFLADRESKELPRSSYPFGLTPLDLRALLPPVVIDGMKGALLAFDQKIPGFASAAGVLIAPETRTTSPLRFLRGPNHESASLPGLIPSGEGAGWGGGIISAAHDGFIVAQAVIG